MKGGMGNKLVLSFVGIALLGLISGAFGYYGVMVGERAIQTSTTTAMDDIDRIAGVIKTVNEIVPRMAAAMEEQ